MAAPGVSPSSGGGSAPPAQPEPSPVLFWETVNAYQRTAALRAAIELGLFTAIGQGADMADSLAGRCGASARGVRILCDYLTVVGFLAKQDDRYRLTPDSAVFLDQRSPAYLGGMLGFINSPELMSGFANLTEVVRRGTTLMAGAGVVDPEDPVWEEFARSMPPMVAPSAEFIGELAVQAHPGPLRVLDIAAGHGLFGIAVAKRNAEARVVALDWPQVLKVAHGNARAAGVDDRYELRPGSAFEVDFGHGFDVVLVSNLFHHFDLPTCGSLARKIHGCLEPGGRAITLEFVPNEDRVSPPIPAAFSLIMLAVTPAGNAYTFPEYDRMFRSAGFARNEIMQVPRSPQQVIVSRR
ncbi:MAG: methyltransferase type 12 [Acidobacteria bacterium]|nr:MAG: methyltransferase type 12 [Acidobacteriota bacterium]